MRPTTLYCQYCELQPCARKSCSRKPLLYPDRIEMVEQDKYNAIRIPERKREWKEPRNCKVNF